MTPQELQSVDVLREVAEAALQQLAAVLELRSFQTGQVIFAEGDPGDSMFFILHGSVAVEKMTGSTGTARKTLAVLETGDYFGEMALLDQKPRSAFAIAAIDTRLARLSKPAFDTLLRHNSDAGLSVLFGMIRTSSERIRRLSSQVVVYDEIGKAMGESKSLPELLDVVLHQLCLSTLADWGLLMLKSQFSNEFEVRSSEGVKLTPSQKQALASGQGFLSRFLQDPRDVVCKNIDDEEPFKSMTRLGFELPALLLSPIRVEDRLLGLIALGDNEVGQFELTDTALVRGVARQTGHAILNALHREEENARSRHSRQFVRF